jgi:Zn-dependent peptidase ImmA (M78 family)
MEIVERSPRSPRSLWESCLQITGSLRSTYESEVPPFSLRGILEHFEVDEVRERLLDRDARLLVDGGRIVIEVNLLFPKVRRRLSIAHEIAHMIVNECAGRARLSISHGDPEEEALCNRLAGELLAPAWALRGYLERSPELLAQEDSIRCSTVFRAAAAFGVSVDVICRRIFQDLRLAPPKIAIIWRERENAQKRPSERSLRICSVWRAPVTVGFVPLNKTAPKDSVISKAFQNGGFLYKEEQIAMGGLAGKFAVEAAAFKCFTSPASRTPATAVLSLLSKTS